jgi:molecular chaperone DnaJ
VNLNEARSILGISEDCSPEEAKKKYRHLTKLYHPDVNKEPDAEEKFKKINEAYECVKNGKGNDLEERFQSPFSTPFEGFNPFSGIPRHEHIEHVRLNEKISFKESVLGCKKNITFNRKSKCLNCNGEGKTIVSNGCQKCGGKGVIVNKQANMVFTQMCNKCRGKVSFENCNKCNSSGFITSEVSAQVSIPGGVQNNNVLRLNGMGNFIGNNNIFNTDQYTDVHLHLSVIPDSELKLIDNDVVCTIEISLLEALKGCSKKVKTILGSKEITINSKSRNKEEIVLPNLGVNQQGSQRVILDVKYPDNIDKLIDVLA